MNGTKVLITGVNGFAGSYLAERLVVAGHQVHGTVTQLVKTGRCQKGICLHTMHLHEPETVQHIIQSIQPSHLYHLAGQSSVALSWEKPAETMETNLIGTIHLLEAVRKTSPDTRVLLVGSSDQYGILKPQECPVAEDHPQRPHSPYATSKKAQEEIGLQYSRAYNMHIVMVRAFNHIGPRQKKGFVVADFASAIAAIEKGTVPPVIKVGNLEASRDFTDVRDIVAGYSLLMKRGEPGEIYNIGSGRSVPVRTILEKLVSLANCPIQVEPDPAKMRPSDVPLIQCDNSKVSKLGWVPTIALDQSLLDTLNAWRNLSSKGNNS